jgi:hypothetical protein
MMAMAPAIQRVMVVVIVVVVVVAVMPQMDDRDWFRRRKERKSSWGEPYLILCR